MEKCLFRARVGISTLIFNHESTFPIWYLDLACEKLHFSPLKKLNRNESTKIQNNCTDGIEQKRYFRKLDSLIFVDLY